MLNLHVGSSSTQVQSALDAPVDMLIHFLFVNSEVAFSDWLYSGVLQDFPQLRVVLSEGQVGWMPFVIQRLDNTWRKTRQNDGLGGRKSTVLPSSALPGRVFGCIFDDLQGLIDREAIGTEQILIETDFPHTDSTYPHSEKLMSELAARGRTERRRDQTDHQGERLRVYGLDRYFGITP